MSTTRTTRRTLALTAAVIGFGLGGFGLAAAAEGVFEDGPSLNEPVESTIPETGDDNGTDAPELGDDNGTDVSAPVTVPEAGDDNGTDAPEIGDDNGGSTPDTIDDSTDSSVPSANPLPAPFSRTYESAGGSVSLTWTGTAFVLESTSAADGFVAEIHDQSWDRVRVDFEGEDGDHRIEVRISDDDNSLRVSIV